VVIGRRPVCIPAIESPHPIKPNATSPKMGVFTVDFLPPTPYLEFRTKLQRLTFMTTTHLFGSPPEDFPYSYETGPPRNFGLTISLYVYGLILVTCTVVYYTSPPEPPTRYPVRESPATWISEGNQIPGLIGTASIDSAVGTLISPTLAELISDSIRPNLQANKWKILFDSTRHDSSPPFAVFNHYPVPEQKTLILGTQQGTGKCCTTISGFIPGKEGDKWAFVDWSSIDNSFHLANLDKAEMARLRTTFPPQRMQEIKLHSVRTPSLSPGLSWGKMANNIPSTMTVDTSYAIIVSITKSLSKAILLQNLDTITSTFKDTAIQVSKLMTVKLVDESHAFSFDTTNNKQQSIDEFGNSTWEWNVEPLSGGWQRLGIWISAEVTVEGSPKPRDLPIFHQTVHVYASLFYPARKFWEKHWEWLIATIFIPFFFKPLFKKIWGGKGDDAPPTQQTE
jgi:hypothetical protein